MFIEGRGGIVSKRSGHSCGETCWGGCGSRPANQQPPGSARTDPGHPSSRYLAIHVANVWLTRRAGVSNRHGQVCRAAKLATETISSLHCESDICGTASALRLVAHGKLIEHPSGHSSQGGEGYGIRALPDGR